MYIYFRTIVLICWILFGWNQELSFLISECSDGLFIKSPLKKHLQFVPSQDTGAPQSGCFWLCKCEKIISSHLDLWLTFDCKLMPSPYSVLVPSLMMVRLQAISVIKEKVHVPSFHIISDIIVDTTERNCLSKVNHVLGQTSCSIFHNLHHCYGQSYNVLRKVHATFVSAKFQPNPLNGMWRVAITRFPLQCRQFKCKQRRIYTKTGNLTIRPYSENTPDLVCRSMEEKAPIP